MRRASMVAHLLVFALAAQGCSDGGAPGPGENGDGQSSVHGELGKLRVIHLVHGATGVDLQLDGESSPWFQRLGYGVSTPWAEVRPNSGMNVEVREMGADPASAPIFSSERLSVASGEKVTMLITGTLDAGEPLRSVVVRHSSQPPPEGKARVLFVNGSGSARSLDVDVGNDGSVELQKVVPFELQQSATFDLDAATELMLGLFAGDDGSPGGSFVLPPLNAGAEVLLVSAGPFERMELFPVDDSGVMATVPKNPVIYLLNASPDSPEVNLFAGTERLVTGLTFGELQRFEIPRGQHLLEVFASAAGPTRPSGSATLRAEMNFRAGERYLVVMGGFFTPKPKGKAGQEEERPLELFDFRTAFAEGAATLMRVVHAIPDAPERIDVGNVPDAAAFELFEELKQISYGQASPLEGFESPLTAMRLGFVPSNTTGLIGAFDFQPQAAQRLFVVATGAVSPDVDEQGFSMLLVDTTREPWQVTRLAPAPAPAPEASP